MFPVEAKENSFTLGGRVIVVSTIRDVTERLLAEREQVQLEARMQQAQKLESLGVLAGGIAHDFNNLLSGILGSIDLASSELTQESSISQSLALARECAERASVLCDQLLAYSGRGRFVVKPASLTTLVDELRPLLEVSLVNKPRLTFELEPTLPLVDVDAAQIRQVILNLVMNAAEATPSGTGHVIVRSNVADISRDELTNCLLGDELPPGRYVTLEVVNNGSGMDETTLSRIFEPFFTTEIRRTRLRPAGASRYSSRPSRSHSSHQQPGARQRVSRAVTHQSSPLIIGALVFVNVVAWPRLYSLRR